MGRNKYKARLTVVHSFNCCVNSLGDQSDSRGHDVAEEDVEVCRLHFDAAHVRAVRLGLDAFLDSRECCEKASEVSGIRA